MLAEARLKVEETNSIRDVLSMNHALSMQAIRTCATRWSTPTGGIVEKNFSRIISKISVRKQILLDVTVTEVRIGNTVS